MPERSKLESLLKTFCDQHLKQDGFNKKVPNLLPKVTVESPRGILTYHDWTSCSASGSLNDVYLLDDGTYDVYTDAGVNHETFNIPVKHCKNLSEVLDFLNEFNYHDPNTTGKLMIGLVGEANYAFQEEKEPNGDCSLLNNDPYNLFLDDKKIKSVSHHDKYSVVLANCGDSDVHLLTAINRQLEYLDDA